MRSRDIVLLCAVGAILSACGAGTPDAPVNTAPSLSITLTNGGVPVTSITSGTPATVKATLKDANGAAVAGAVVTFSTDSTLATITPAETALTDASTGIATVTLSPATVTAAGATTITATSQVGTTTLTGAIGYSVGGAVVTITNPAFGVSPLSAFGTTSVAVTVSSGGVAVTTPQTVTFSSPCSSSGKAVLSASVVTVNGTATGSYRDNGCAGTDTVTASVSGIASSSATLIVAAPTAGSIQYVSSAPTNISLKGTGGIETAQVTFKVLDTGGIPLSGKEVTFGLSTAVGGITLTPGGTATSDASGLVVTNVNAGTVSTPVRVTASMCSTATSPCTGTILATQSSQLTLTTGIPDQFGFSLSATERNIEGWNVDGTTTTLTASLADHFKNPVPDGTAVVFTAEAGSVVGTCSTVAGACSVPYTSQGTRPLNGRVTVLAYAVGEETFTDLNGSGWADLSPNEMIDPNGNPTDLPEVFVDYNENGIFDAASETYIDFNNDRTYNAADGKFSGVLCDNVAAGRSSAGTCSPAKTVHVRQSGVIVLSSSTANITINGGTPIAIPPCNLATGNESQTFTVTVVDKNGNAMPAGTTVGIESTNGIIITPATSYIVPSSSGCRIGYTGCPASIGTADFGDISVSMQGDVEIIVNDIGTASCNYNLNASGTLTVTVTTPGGRQTYATATVTD